MKAFVIVQAKHDFSNLKKRFGNVVFVTNGYEEEEDIQQRIREVLKAELFAD